MISIRIQMGIRDCMERIVDNGRHYHIGGEGEGGGGRRDP